LVISGINDMLIFSLGFIADNGFMHLSVALFVVVCVFLSFLMFCVLN
jgi:hypothetical protein